ncbi:MAG: glycosyltransferase, partial [Desulfovibrionaceae bacterium]|nr:glycosyltransferase [Desulfovibrionaceae bacterium]
DEPTGALDQRTSRLIMDNFRALCHRGGVALVMVTHDAKMAEFCDSVYTLEEGVLVCQRRTIPDVSTAADGDLLRGPEIRLHTAMVSGNFLRAEGEGPRAEAHLLHEKGLLTHVVTLKGGSLLGKEMQTYSLPMPVCHMGGPRATSVMAAYLSPGGARLPQEKQQDAGLVRNLLKGSCSTRWARAQAQELARWSAAEKVECLYAAGGRRAPVVCWLASQFSGIPYAMEVRDTDRWLSAVGKDDTARGLSVLVRDAAFVRCATEDVCTRIRALLPDALKNRARFVPDPLTLAPMDEEIAICQTHEATKLTHIMACGALERRKGYDVLLKALARIRATGREFRCTIAGAGPEAKSLRRLAKQLGLLSCVRFTGFVPHANMNSLLLDTDIFVAPGVTLPNEPVDGIPSALAEAMAFFVPVVASDLPGQKWLAGNGAGIIVPQGDEAALADALEPLLGMEHDDLQRRLAIGTAGRERVLKLLGSVGDELAALFAPLTAGASAGK